MTGFTLPLLSRPAGIIVAPKIISATLRLNEVQPFSLVSLEGRLGQRLEHELSAGFRIAQGLCSVRLHLSLPGTLEDLPTYTCVSASDVSHEEDHKCPRKINSSSARLKAARHVLNLRSKKRLLKQYLRDLIDRLESISQRYTTT